MTILLATANDHKIEEIKEIFATSGFQLKTPPELGIYQTVDEDGTTYAANALKKARAYFSGSGPVIADDSGIEIAALDGRPGVFSARWLGDNRDSQSKNAEVLRLLDGKKNRRARYVCVVALIEADGKESLFSGYITGEIAVTARGCRGFGYDPIFVLPDGRTMAELSRQEKNLISHRAQAFGQAIAYIKEKYA